MKKLFFLLLLIFSGIFQSNQAQPRIFQPRPPFIPVPSPYLTPKIQAAILLDVSNSMDGLIEQAKAQLWNMVITLGKTRCNGITPNIEIALYEYGRTTNPIQTGYVKKLSDFTTDLDKLSEILFGLTTNGGDEYCGQVIYSSLNNLNWDSNPLSYKTIFIAGNEDFLQGRLHYSRGCSLAKSKGVVVNAIYCGDRAQGISEHWNLIGECGGGSFTNINQDEKVIDISTPYDDEIIALNDQLNKTYIGYGADASEKLKSQILLDSKNNSIGKSVAVKRAIVKGNKAIYKNSNWDLVDKAGEDKEFINKMDVTALPDSLRSRSKAQIQKMITTKSEERNKIQQKITEKTIARDQFLAKEKAKQSTVNQKATLETEVEKIIRKQVRAKKMDIQ
jgi:hypothetical protein